MSTPNRSDSEDLFPLRMTAFEEVMFADDRPDFPMCFFIEIGVTGTLDRDALTSALKKSVNRHPLLNAVAERRWLRWHWTPLPTDPDITFLDGIPVLPASNLRQIDLMTSPGLKTWVGCSTGESRLIFQFHHAATDGIGAMEFIGDVLAHYGQLTAQSDETRPEPCEIDSRVLAFRGKKWFEGHRPRHLLRRFLWRVWDIMSIHPSAVYGRRTGSPKPASQSSSLPFITRILDSHDAAHLRAEASAEGCSVNDLVSCCMFLTLRDWQNRLGVDTDDTIIRIGLPASTRTPEHDHCPAANILSYILLTRRSADLLDKRSILKYVTSETAEVTQSGDTGLVLLSMELGCLIPGFMNLVTRIPWNICSTILANVGDVRRQLRASFPVQEGRCVAGSIRLEYLLGAAPVRRGTHIATSIGKYAGRLFINMNFAPDAFTELEREEFADSFVRTLRQYSHTTKLEPQLPDPETEVVQRHEAVSYARQPHPAATAVSRRSFRFWTRFLLFPALAVLLYPFFIAATPTASPAELALWTAGLTYCWFCVGGMFHETAHDTLFRSPLVNRLIGRCIGTLIAIPLTTYRETHRRHHAYLNTIDDYELWPYADPRCSLRFRRVFVWLDLFLGIITAPLIYGRVYFLRDARVRPETRNMITFEYLLVMLFWTALPGVAITWMLKHDVPFQLRQLTWFLPLTLAPILNTARKFIEHLGLNSDDPLMGTRTIVGGNLFSRLCRYFNFDIATHGPHHRYPKASHEDLASLMKNHLSRSQELQQRSFHSYLAAAIDTLPHLWKNPASGCTLQQNQKPSIEP